MPWNEMRLGLARALNSYLTEEEIGDLYAMLTRRSRVSRPFRNWFVKARTRGDQYGFGALQNEVRFYRTFESLPIKVPRLHAMSFTDDWAVLVYERIQGSPLAEHRNSYTMRYDANLNAVLAEVRKLQAVACPEGYPGEYERSTKLAKYLPIIRTQLTGDACSFLEAACDRWSCAPPPLPVLSHGDLLPVNILLDGNQNYWLVDWEFAAPRPASYDPALLVLFSNWPLKGVSMLRGFDSLWSLSELYKDAIVIAAREVKNWLTQVEEEPLRSDRVCLWVAVLEEAIRCLKSL